MIVHRSYLSAAVSPDLLHKAKSAAGLFQRKRPIEERVSGTLSIGRRRGEVENDIEASGCRTGPAHISNTSRICRERGPVQILRGANGRDLRFCFALRTPAAE